MNHAQTIFTEICLADNAGNALRTLAAEVLADLIRYLRESGPDGSVGAMVLAMAEWEAVERFLKIQESKA